MQQNYTDKTQKNTQPGLAFKTMGYALYPTMLGITLLPLDPTPMIVLMYTVLGGAAFSIYKSFVMGDKIIQRNQIQLVTAFIDESLILYDHIVLILPETLQKNLEHAFNRNTDFIRQHQQ